MNMRSTSTERPWKAPGTRWPTSPKAMKKIMNQNRTRPAVRLSPSATRTTIATLAAIASVGRKWRFSKIRS